MNDLWTGPHKPEIAVLEISLCDGDFLLQMIGRSIFTISDRNSGDSAR